MASANLHQQSASGSRPTMEIEKSLGYPNKLLVGVDEVGRGCLAGPVVAAAVILPQDIAMVDNPWINEVRDSKQLRASERERLAPLIERWAKSTSIGTASVDEIDQMNIFHATHLAMLRAVEALNIRPDHMLVDGKFSPKGLAIPVTPVIKGDQKSLAIACASILAKVWRDFYMIGLDTAHPGYGFAKHKGYSTSIHRVALKNLGVTNVHRRSFAPVAELL